MSLDKEFCWKKKIQVWWFEQFVMTAIVNFASGLYSVLSSYTGSCQHLLLATMFALNFCYQPVDLVLVIKCGILEILSMLTNNSCSLMNQGWFAASASGPVLLTGAVRLASARLLQILTVAARWGSVIIANLIVLYILYTMYLLYKYDWFAYLNFFCFSVLVKTHYQLIYHVH